MSATATRSRQPKGVPVGGQFATETHAEATGVTLTPAVEETVFTKRYDTLDEKVQAFHDELEQQVADLADDDNWQHYLNTMSKFHRYSGGGVGVFEAQELRLGSGRNALSSPAPAIR